MENIVFFGLGIGIGLAIAIAFIHFRKKDQTLLESQMRERFSATSLEALQKNTESFLSMANEKLGTQTQLNAKELQHKKEQVDHTLTEIKKEMTRVKDTVTILEKDREKKFGELQHFLKMSTEQTQRLSETTGQLKEALANSKVRGQWGERMAEDVLRISGLVEGINYAKQTALEYSRSIPDFTFFLPNDLKVNMDVKFPLNNYMKYLDCDNDNERDGYKQQFLKDVKLRIQEVTSKDYINPESNTVDYVLVFIPNEQIYGFINEHDLSLIDQALKKKVIFCSPLTLYALLAVIRQAIDNFTMEKTASEMLSHIGTFYNQWKKYQESLEKMGRRFDDVKKEFENLTTTRKNQLERPLLKIQELRESKQIIAAESVTEIQSTVESELST